MKGAAKEKEIKGNATGPMEGNLVGRLQFSGKAEDWPLFKTSFKALSLRIPNSLISFLPGYHNR
jgi:hypothetical protein